MQRITSFQYDSLKLSKWQIATVIGASATIGVGIYLYNRSASSKPAVAPKDAQDKQTTTANAVEKKDEVVTLLQQAIAYKNEGNVCYRNGKYDEAIAFYDKAIDKCPISNNVDLAIFYQNRAAAYEILKKWTAVKDDCARSLEHNHTYVKAYNRRAKAHEACGDLQSCLEDVTAACILEKFQNNNTILYADRILKQTGRLDAENYMKIRQPQLPSAVFIRSYIETFVQDPVLKKDVPELANEGLAHGYVRAKQALKERRYDDVIPACTEEIESSESDAQHKTEAMLLRGTFYLLQGIFKEAKDDFNAIISNENADKPLRVYAYLRRAAVNIQQEEKELGLADFDEAERLWPGTADVYQQRAQIYLLLDMLPESIEQFDKSLKLAGDHAIAYVQKSYAEYRSALGAQDSVRVLESLGNLKNSIDKFPNSTDAHSLMAQVMADQAEFDRSDSYYLKAIQLAPENATLHVQRAILQLQWKGDVEEAVRLLQHAISLDPKCELAYETFGTVEVQRGNLELAVELFENAVKLAKTHAEMSHLFALRNAAQAQINISNKLKIDINTLARLHAPMMA